MLAALYLSLGEGGQQPTVAHRFVKLSLLASKREAMKSTSHKRVICAK